MGVDTAVLAGPGMGRDQHWTHKDLAPLVRAHEQGTPMYLFRQKSRSGQDKNKQEYLLSGVYRIADRWRAWLTFVEPEEDCDGDGGDGGAAGGATADGQICSSSSSDSDSDTGRAGPRSGPRKAVGKAAPPDGFIHCFIKLERLAGQDPVETVKPQLKLPNRKRNPVAAAMAKRRHKQLLTSIAILDGTDILDEMPELCANCLMDGDGRTDTYECDGCGDRLGVAAALRKLKSPLAPKLPAPCVDHGCSLRVDLHGDLKQCVHITPSLLCYECVDMGDAAVAAAPNTAWVCAACADWFGAWGGQTRHTARGRFLPQAELDLAKERRQRDPRLAAAWAMAAADKAAAEVEAAAKKKRKEERETKKKAEEKEAAEAVTRHRSDRRARGGGARAKGEAGPSRVGPTPPRKRKAAARSARAEDEVGPSQRRAAEGGEGGAGRVGPSRAGPAARTKRRAAAKPAASSQCDLPVTEELQFPEDAGDEVLSPGRFQSPPEPAPAAGPAAAATASPVAVKAEPSQIRTTPQAAEPAAVRAHEFSVVFAMVQGFPEVNESRGLIGRYAAKYRTMSPAEQHKENNTVSVLAQIDGHEVRTYLEGRVA